MTRVRWTIQAEADLESIRQFIERDSTYYAAIVLDRIIASVDRLETFPLSGRVVPERQDQTLREVVQSPFRIVYRLVGDEAHVVTVFRSSRLFPDLGPL